MTENGMKAVGAVCLMFVLVTLFICLSFGPNTEDRRRPDEQIERLEQKVDQIHRVVVGGK